MGQRVSFSDQVRRAAHELAFDVVGIARCGPGIRLDDDVARWRAFVDAGMAGEMGWLGDHGGVRARLDGEGMLAGARSVVCLARRYHAVTEPSSLSPAPASALASPPAPAPPSPAPDTLHAIARYARGRDYHKFLRKRLLRVATFLRSLGTEEEPVHARVFCDDDPVFERAWAARAGLGFVGKNGMLIVPGVGSMVLLGEVVTTLELEPGTPMTERCGTCTRCLDACPTQAFVRPFVLDPRRCISYLTIEHKSAIDPALREPMGGHLFGCDDCQTVCPFNAGTQARAPLTDTDGDPFAPLERWTRLGLEDLLAVDEAEWNVLREGTPLARAGRVGLARNAAIVLGNRGDVKAAPALRRTARDHDDAIVREAAAWALERLGG
ncbi:MAG TPA: tRNA epoxyqueuosine(34) reductase QueG [Polyangiaceae bacterium]